MTSDAEEQVERDFAGALERLTDPSGPHLPGQLFHLSHAGAEEIERWRERWPRVEPQRRETLAQAMLEAAEADIHLDFSALFKNMLDDAIPSVRAVAIDGLWEARDLSLIDRYSEALRTDLSSMVRGRAAAGLGAYLQREELGEIKRGRTETALSTLVDVAADESEDMEVRRRATESVGYADDDTVRLLIERLISAEATPLRAGALRAMGNSADERWTSTVRAFLNADEAELRFEAARAAGELLIQTAVDELADLASEDEREVREQAIWAIGEIGGSTARRILERLEEEEEDEELLRLIEDATSSAALNDGELDIFSFDPFGGHDEVDLGDERLN